MLHQAGILEQFGEVTIVDFPSPEFADQQLTSPAVKRIRVQAPAGRSELVSRTRAMLRYRRALGAAMERSPDAIVAFEPDAAALLLGAARRDSSRLIVHLHEHFSADGYAKSRVSRWSLQRTLRSLNQADMVIVPDRDRAAQLKSHCNLARDPIVVMNCPRRIEEPPRSALKAAITPALSTDEQIVHYQGSVGPDHGLEVVLRSMHRWPQDSRFVAVGGGAAEYVQSLLALSGELGVAERVHFLGRVPYDKVMSFAAGAAVGVTFLDTRHENWRMAAGASNKRFEYSALGIPQVTNPGPGIRELFLDPGIALAADPLDHADVGEKIALYLSNRALREEAGRRARALHLEFYNYEAQYEPVLAALGLA